MRKLKTFELNRLTINDFKDSKKLPIVVILDDIRSMYNVGSVFRTSDAFFIQEIHLCGITPKPPHREIHKTAIGATESVDWKYFEKIEQSVNELKKKGFKIIGIEQTDSSVLLEDFNISVDQKFALILGNEVMGITDSILNEIDICVEIPQYGTKHSLNVSVAAGIVLHHFTKHFITT